LIHGGISINNWKLVFDGVACVNSWAILFTCPQCWIMIPNSILWMLPLEMSTAILESNSIQRLTATLEKDPLLRLDQPNIMDRTMLFLQGQSHHWNNECTFLCQLYYDNKRKKHKLYIYIYLVWVSSIYEWSTTGS